MYEAPFPGKSLRSPKRLAASAAAAATHAFANPQQHVIPYEQCTHRFSPPIFVFLLLVTVMPSSPSAKQNKNRMQCGKTDPAAAAKPKWL